jgi:hypothetical protein
MPPRHVHVSQHDRDFHAETRLQESTNPVSQHDPDDADEVIEEMQDNPGASESVDDRSTAALRTRHHSRSRPRKGTLPTHEAGVRPSRRQGTTQLRQREPARSRRQTSWDADSSLVNSSEATSEDASSGSDVGSRHPESPGRNLERKIRHLQRKLASLHHSGTNPDDGRGTSASAKSWKVLHEVQCLNTRHLASYLDEPELENDRDLRHLHWQGNKQLTNLRAWTRKQSQPFIAHRMYRCAREDEEPSDPSEKIAILSPELDHIIKSWLDASSGLAIYNSDGVYFDQELKSPYLCFYHFQHEVRDLLSASGSVSQDALLLLDYLNASTKETAREAEAMFASGKVTAKLMPYLFKPGALVCFEESGDFVVCEQVSLLTMFSENGDLQRRVFELSTVRIAFDGKFRRLRPFVHRINFRALGDEPLDIADLSVQPLSWIPSERRAELKRRGDTFLRCQKQLYVTYPSRGGHQDFVCHLHHCLIRACTVENLTAA